MLFVAYLLFFGYKKEMPPKIESTFVNRIVDERYISIFEAKTYDKDLKLDVKTEINSVSYTDIKADIQQLRKHLVKELQSGNIFFENIKAEFTNYLVDKIIPYWYGTPWSFEGHTSMPNQGNIACGYFISTTLRDMGIKLNRYKLAQKSPLDEAKVISCGSVIYNVVQESPEKAFEEINHLTKEGLYFIGFDKGHVGYLLKRKGELFLIHSNYLYPGLVCIELLEESRVFKSFSKFHLADISNNERLLKHWLNDGIVL